MDGTVPRKQSSDHMHLGWNRQSVSSSVTRKMNDGMKTSSLRSQAPRSNQTIFDIIEERDGCGNIAHHPGSSSGYSDGWEEVLLQTGGLQETRNHSDERWIRIDKAMTEDEVAKIKRNKEPINWRIAERDEPTERQGESGRHRRQGQEDKRTKNKQDIKTTGVDMNSFFAAPGRLAEAPQEHKCVQQQFVCLAVKRKEEGSW